MTSSMVWTLRYWLVPAGWRLIVECHDIVDKKMCHHIVDKVL